MQAFDHIKLPGVLMDRATASALCSCSLSEECSVSQSDRGDDKIRPERQYVGLFGQIHISKQYENRRLEEEQQGHLDQTVGERQQSNQQAEETEHAKHAWHMYIPLSHEPRS